MAGPSAGEGAPPAGPRRRAGPGRRARRPDLRAAWPSDGAPTRSGAGSSAWWDPDRRGSPGIARLAAAGAAGGWKADHPDHHRMGIRGRTHPSTADRPLHAASTRSRPAHLAGDCRGSRSANPGRVHRSAVCLAASTSMVARYGWLTRAGRAGCAAPDRRRGRGNGAILSHSAGPTGAGGAASPRRGRGPRRCSRRRSRGRGQASGRTAATSTAGPWRRRRRSSA